MKILKLNGIRKRAILCRSNDVIKTVIVMIPITEEQEKEIDDNGYINVDGLKINASNIYCYGNIDINNNEDLKSIEKFDLIGKGDDDNYIYSNYNYEKGIVEYDSNVPKTYPINNTIEWFKYNYLLIGKPERILIYKCKMHDL